MRDDRSEDRIEDEGEALHDGLQAERQGAASSHAWHGSIGLRRRVVAYARACIEHGESHRGIARRLGLAQPTLSRWIRDGAGYHGDFHAVAIVPSGRPAGAPVAGPAPRELRLVTPRGFVVEGLDIERLASLLQVLG